MQLTKPFIMVAALVAAVAASARRRRTQTDADQLWRDATSHTST